MRVSPAAFIILGSVLAGAAPASSDPAGPAAADGLSSWAAVVRSRVVGAVTTIRRTAALGRVTVGFTVTEDGDIVGVRIDGSPRTAARVAAALRALDKVPPPPDHRSHAVNVGLNIR